MNIDLPTVIGGVAVGGLVTALVKVLSMIGLPGQYAGAAAAVVTMLIYIPWVFGGEEARQILTAIVAIVSVGLGAGVAYGGAKVVETTTTTAARKRHSNR